MARPRLTAVELRAKGVGPGSPNYTRYRDRLAEAEAPSTAKPLPFKPLSKVPPAHLSPKQKQLWKRLLAQVPAGVLSRSHAVIVEVAVSLWEKVSENSAKPSEISQLRVILESFSMVPNSKPHEAAPPAKPGRTDAADEDYDLLADLEREQNAR